MQNPPKPLSIPQQFPLLMSSLEHKAHFHVWFHMFHIYYRQSQRMVHGGAQCDLIRHNHTVITDASRSSAHVISCTLGCLLIIEGTYVDCPVCVSCEWNHRWPPTAHTWWDLDFDPTPLPAAEHIIFSVWPITHSVQNIRAMFQNLVSCLTAYIGIILTVMKPHKWGIWNALNRLQQKALMNSIGFPDSMLLR